MTQNYTKKPENYNDNLFFDNDIYENEANLPRFNLEKLARNAAQQMIQEALELEVLEFLERGRHAKTNPEDFRGYRGRASQRANYFDARSVVWKSRFREFQITRKPFNHN